MTQPRDKLAAVRRAAGRVARLAIVPLSIVPLVYGGSQVIQMASADQPVASIERKSLAPPPVALTAAQRRRWQPLPPNHRAIPVLAYHGINNKSDFYSVSRLAFARQMAMLRNAGFETITTGQLARALHGDTRGMPARPILITFDDGRFDSYQGADQSLRRNGFSATMFVIVGWVGRYRFYANWRELSTMQRSGRWDLQVHAGVGHYNVPYDAQNDSAPYYAVRRWLKGAAGRPGRVETFAEYKARVTRDINFGRDKLAAMTGSDLSAFAAPYGNIGGARTNDGRISKFLVGWLKNRFPVVFQARGDAYLTQASPPENLNRFEIHTNTTTDELYRWLKEARPR